MTSESGIAVWLPREGTDEWDSVSEPLFSGLGTLAVAGAPGDLPRFRVAREGRRATVTVEAGPRLRLSVLIPTRDAEAVWVPGSAVDHSHLPVSWGAPTTVAALSGFAVGALLARGGHAPLAWAAVSGDDRIRVRVGIIEEDAGLLLSVERDAGGGAPLRLELDAGGGSFVDAVGGVVDRAYGSWQEVAAADERPVLSTWYAMHLDLDEHRIRALAERAGDWGFGTLIVDDGWQTRELGRGYGSAGDWEVEPAKISDPAALVDAYASRGMRVMWWVALPFAGHRSRSHAATSVLFERPEIDAGVIDPRDPDTRARLLDRLSRLLAETGAHGLKVDFLEQFAGAPSAGPDVDAAALRLVRDVVAALRTVRTDVSLEFREPYFGPTALAGATMIRVGDAPMSPPRNRIGIADLRLSTRGVAVHSDPIMWGADDTPERVAQHLQNALFGVPQISVDIAALPAAHEEVVRFWLDFARRLAPTLLRGAFVPARPELGYPTITAAAGDTVVTGRYLPVAVSVPEGDWRVWHLANADEATVHLATDPDGISSVVVRDARGRVISRNGGSPGVVLTVPTGGLATFERDDR